MKRILIFSLAYIPHVGGAEIAIKEITSRVSDMEFHLLTLNFGGEEKEEKIGNVFVHRIGNGTSYFSKILFIPRAAFAARALHRTHQFDALWAMMSYMLFPIVLARLNVPYVLTLQEGDPWEHMFSRWFILPLRPLLVSGFKQASAVSAISTYLAGWAERMGYRGVLEIIGNGVDVEHFTPVLGARRADTVSLVTTSRLVRKNAVDDVIRALILLPDNVRFIVYGKGQEERALTSLAERLHVAHRVRFEGELPHADLPRALVACDIFVRPSRSEGMGNSFIEAMAAGLPVIGTQEGGIADFLFDAKRNPDKETTGWAVDKDSPEQIAEAVKDILARPEEAQRVAANARRFVAERYEWDHIAARMKALLERVVANR